MFPIIIANLIFTSFDSSIGGHMKIISVQPTYTRFTNTFKKNSIAQEERNIENQKHDLDNETNRISQEKRELNLEMTKIREQSHELDNNLRDIRAQKHELDTELEKLQKEY